LHIRQRFNELVESAVTATGVARSHKYCTMSRCNQWDKRLSAQNGDPRYYPFTEHGIARKTTGVCEYTVQASGVAHYAILAC
jgi:hypothetical protein